MSLHDGPRPGFVAKLFSFGATLYIAVGFGVFLSVADNYMRKSGSLPVPPTIAAVIFLLSILVVVIVRDFLAHQPSVRLGFVLKSNMAVIVPFFLLAFVSLILALHPTAYWGDDRKWIYLQTYDFFIFVIAMMLPAVDLIKRRFKFFVIVGLLTALGSIWYEVQNPSTFSSVPGRASGFPGNSNWGALITVMICSMSLGYKDGPSRMWDMVLLAITGLGLYFTFSRSGTLNFVMLLLFYLFVALRTGKNPVKSALTLILGVGFLVSFFVLIVPLVSQNVALMEESKSQNRLLALFEGEVVDDGSANDRMEAARETLDKIESSPIIGHGTGFNRKMRQTPHNLYLKLWVDSGIFGLILWLVLLASGFWLFSSRKYYPGQGLVLVTLFGGFFSHNILEQRTFLFLFGMAASVSLFESAQHLQRRVLSAHAQSALRENPREAL